MAEVICHFQNDIRDLQILLPLFFYGRISKQSAEDISGNSAGRITVAFMIDRRYDARGKIILIFQGAVQRNAKGLFRDPAFSQLMN